MAKEAKKIVRSLKGRMSSLFDLVEMLDLIVPYFTLMQAFPSNLSKTPPASLSLLSLRGDEEMQEARSKGMVEEATS